MIPLPISPMLPLLAETAGFNALVRAKHGLMLFNKNDTYIGRSIGKYGEFSEGEIAIFDQLCRPGDIVVEVGANIGTHTLPIAKMVGVAGRVHAFEPQRIVFQTLCANMALTVSLTSNVIMRRCQRSLGRCIFPISRTTRKKTSAAWKSPVSAKVYPCR